MKEIEKVICNYMYKFVKEHWNKIDKELCGIKQSKTAFLKEVKTDIHTAMWIFSEVASWGMDKSYLNELIVYDPEDALFRVMKIGDMHIKFEWIAAKGEYKLQLVKPKTKQIVYFE